jgi:hypothetical protein
MCQHTGTFFVARYSVSNHPNVCWNSGVGIGYGHHPGRVIAQRGEHPAIVNVEVGVAEHD